MARKDEFGMNDTNHCRYDWTFVDTQLKFIAIPIGTAIILTYLLK
jgi:hypothetical protein